MIFEIPQEDIFKMLHRQINTFIPISKEQEYDLKDYYRK